MEFEVLGCSGGESPERRLTSLLINQTTAIDAGCISQVLSLQRQMPVQRLLLSHSHVDHVASLPFFLDNRFQRAADGLEIWASPATIYALRRNLFNPASWPDFTRLPNHLLPTASFAELEDGRTLEFDRVRYTPIAVNHVVPTHGFLIEELPDPVASARHGSAVLWSSDTGPTDLFWEVANSTPGLAAICVDVSFDNELQAVAAESRHLTPRSLGAELEKLRVDVPIFIHHMKPACEDAIRAEVAELSGYEIGFLEQGRVYSF